MRKCCIVNLSLFLGAVMTLAAIAQTTSESKPFDWPQWRGPNRDGMSKETDLLPAWPKEGPPLVWTTKNLGAGYSSVAVAAGRIYTMGGRGNDDSVIALDESTGKEIWRTRVGDYFRQNMGDGPRCTPTVDGDSLYALGGAGDLVCLEAATGKLRWRKSLPKDLGGRMMSGWGWSESPLIDGDKVICTPGSENAAMAALNKKTGAVLWKATVAGGNGAGYSSPVAAEVGGIRMYITWLKTCIFGVAAKDGKFLWKYGRNANGTANIPTPIVHDDLVFCSTGYGAGTALLKLVPSGGGIKAEELYYLDGKTLQNHHGGMVLLDGYIYCGHNHNKGWPTCVELKSGKVVWQEMPFRDGSASICYADGHLYYRHDKGSMLLIEALPKAYKETGRFKLPNESGKPSWPHPVVANGKLYIRDQDVLMCYDVKQKVAGR